MMRYSLVILVGLGACTSQSGGPVDGAVDAGTPVAKSTVGPAGGSVSFNGDQIGLYVPPGALDRELVLSLEVASDVPPGHVGTAYEIGPSGTTFASPVQIVFRYAESDLAGFPPEALRLATVIDGRWVSVSQVAVDRTAGWVVGTTRHLSPYGLIVPSCTSEAQCLGMALSHCVASALPGEGFCAVPCSEDDDCPRPLQCAAGACIPRSCERTGACPAEMECNQRICLEPCSEGCAASYTTCMVYDRSGPAPRGWCDLQWCSVLGCEGEDLCTWNVDTDNRREAGTCLPLTAGCDCSEPECPCLERPDAGTDDAGTEDAGPPSCGPGAPCDCVAGRYGDLDIVQDGCVIQGLNHGTGRDYDDLVGNQVTVPGEYCPPNREGCCNATFNPTSVTLDCRRRGGSCSSSADCTFGDPGEIEPGTCDVSQGFGVCVYASGATIPKDG